MRTLPAMRFFFLLTLYSLMVLPLWAQAPEGVVERWREGQMAAFRNAGTVRCVEESDRRVEGPNKTREIHLVSRLRLVPGLMTVEREVERVEMNGRPVPEGERQRMTRFLSHGRHGHGQGGGRGQGNGRGAERERVVDLLFWPARFAAGLHPAGTLQSDPQADRALRLDLIGAPDQSVERLTLWFTPRGDRLLRARLLARHRPEDPPLVVETHYRRYRGLDVPERRHVEGSMLVTKRGRTYTLRYEQQVAYRDYRFER